MNAPMADANEPDLGIGTACKESPCRIERLVRDLELTGFQVNRDNSPVVAGFDFGAYSVLVDLRSDSSVLLFAQTRLSNCHIGSPVVDCVENKHIVRKNHLPVRAG